MSDINSNGGNFHSLKLMHSDENIVHCFLAAAKPLSSVSSASNSGYSTNSELDIIIKEKEEQENREKVKKVIAELILEEFEKQVAKGDSDNKGLEIEPESEGEEAEETLCAKKESLNSGHHSDSKISSSQSSSSGVSSLSCLTPSTLLSDLPPTPLANLKPNKSSPANTTTSSSKELVDDLMMGVVNTARQLDRELALRRLTYFIQQKKTLIVSQTEVYPDMKSTVEKVKLLEKRVNRVAELSSAFRGKFVI